MIWVLPTGYPCALPGTPNGVLAMVLHGLTLAANQRLTIGVARFETAVDLRVIPPPVPRPNLTSGPTAREWLATRHPGTGQAAPLEPHGH